MSPRGSPVPPPTPLPPLLRRPHLLPLQRKDSPLAVSRRRVANSSLPPKPSLPSRPSCWPRAPRHPRMTRITLIPSHRPQGSLLPTLHGRSPPTPTRALPQALTLAARALLQLKGTGSRIAPRPSDPCLGPAPARPPTLLAGLRITLNLSSTTPRTELE